MSKSRSAQTFLQRDAPARATVGLTHASSSAMDWGFLGAVRAVVFGFGWCPNGGRALSGCS